MLLSEMILVEKLNKSKELYLLRYNAVLPFESQALFRWNMSPWPLRSNQPSKKTERSTTPPKLRLNVNVAQGIAFRKAEDFITKIERTSGSIKKSAVNLKSERNIE
jgi:hypothetical protein